MGARAAVVRLFVAIDPPLELACAMLESLGSLGLPDHRAVPAGQIHMTLQFIGDRPVRELDATIESVERSAAGLRGFSLEPVSLIRLPERGQARLVAATTSTAPTLLELKRRLASRLARSPRHRPELRFLPHLTLCRMRPPVRLDIGPNQLDLPAFDVDRVRLVKSVLHPQGARHDDVAVFELEG